MRDVAVLFAVTLSSCAHEAPQSAAVAPAERVTQRPRSSADTSRCSGPQARICDTLCQSPEPWDSDPEAIAEWEGAVRRCRFTCTAGATERDRWRCVAE